MITSLLIFTPTFVCLFSTIAHLKLSSRTDAYWLLVLMGFATSLFLLSEACLTDARASLQKLTHVKFLGLLAGPCVIPLMLMYLGKLRYPKVQYRQVGLLWVVLPAVLFTASLVMYLMIGEETILPFMEEMKVKGLDGLDEYRGSAESVYFVLTEIVFRILLAAEALIMIIQITLWAVKDKFSPRNVMAFIKEGKTLKVASIQMFFIIPVLVSVILKAFDLPFDFSNQRLASAVLSVILAIFMCGLEFTAIFSSKKEITRKEMRFASLYNYGYKDKGTVVEEMMNILLDEAETEALERVQQKIGKNLHIDEFKSEEASPERSEVATKIFEAVTDSYDEGDMLGRFQRLMRDEMLFLKPGLSLDDVAEKLDTNKFYISKMVNNTFNMGFPEVVNILRVDYAEQYIMNHPDAKQTEIAQECGFFSASTFNTIFKKVTGMTPKMWVAAKEHSEQQ